MRSSLIRLSCVFFFSSKAWYGEYRQQLHSNSVSHKIWYRFRVCSCFSADLFCIVACILYKLNTITTNVFCNLRFPWNDIPCFRYTFAMIKHHFPTVFTFQSNSLLQYYVWHDDPVVLARFFIRLISNSALHFLLAWSCKMLNFFSLNAFSISISASAIIAFNSTILFSFASTVRFLKSVSIRKVCSKIKSRTPLFKKRRTISWSSFRQSRNRTLFVRHTFAENFFCVKRILCRPYCVLKR